jgi:hypothetical protein
MASVLPYFSEELGRSLEVYLLNLHVKNRPKNHHMLRFQPFLNRVEKDLFDTTRSNYVTDNLTSEEPT